MLRYMDTVRRDAERLLSEIISNLECGARLTGPAYLYLSSGDYEEEKIEIRELKVEDGALMVAVSDRRAEPFDCDGDGEPLNWFGFRSPSCATDLQTLVSIAKALEQRAAAPDESVSEDSVGKIGLLLRTASIFSGMTSGDLGNGVDLFTCVSRLALYLEAGSDPVDSTLFFCRDRFAKAIDIYADLVANCGPECRDDEILDICAAFLQKTQERRPLWALTIDRGRFILTMYALPSQRFLSLESMLEFLFKGAVKIESRRGCIDGVDLKRLLEPAV